MRLTLAQAAYAQTLQRRGRLLREIAAEMGFAYEVICLALYGDGADWAAPAGAVAAVGETENPDGGFEPAAPESRGDSVVVGALAGGEGLAGVPALPDAAESEAQAAIDADNEAQELIECHANADDDATVLREAPPAPVAKAESVSRLAAGRAADAGEVDAGTAEAKAFLNAETSRAPIPADHFRLKAGSGEYLSKSGVGMTDDIGRAWHGSAEQVETIRSRFVQHQGLVAEPVHLPEGAKV